MAYGIKLHCWGGLACFTRPEMKVERVSYEVITPSAARGILEAIFWKPEIRWVIDRLRILKPIRFTSLRRNEVGKKASTEAAIAGMKAARGYVVLCVEDERQQRAALLLQDVAYVIEAHFDIVVAHAGDNGKYLDQFNRRARNGQCYTRPYLGCREFAAHFRLIESEEAMPAADESLHGTRDLGWMLHDINFQNGREPQFFHAVMVDGMIEVPPLNTENGQ